MRYLEFEVTDGPSVRTLAFSLTDPTYAVNFTVEGLGKYPVNINRLVETSHPSIWAWRGVISGNTRRRMDAAPEVCGLIDVTKRDGVFHSLGPISKPNGPTVSISQLDYCGFDFHPVEFRLSGRNAVAMGEGPGEERLRACIGATEHGARPPVVVTAGGKRYLLKLDGVIEFPEGWYFSAKTVPSQGEPAVEVLCHWLPGQRKGLLVRESYKVPADSLRHVKD